jgi:large subunit ribosomal protein L10
MDRNAKHKLRDEFVDLFKDATGLVVTEYRGLTVEELTQLRVQLRKAGAKFKIVKNRVAKKAIESGATDVKPLSDRFRGPIGVVVSYKDAAQTTKTVFDFEKDHPNFVVKAGFIDNGVYSPGDLKAMAALPSKDVLLGMILGTLLNPHRGLVTVLSGVSRNLVQVVNAIKDKKTS